MTTHVDEKIYGKVMEVHLNGTLTKEDYARFVPDTEELIRQHEKIRMLIIMDDFQGWDAGALWEDIKWDMKHFNHIERVAAVGDRKWEKWMCSFCKPFTTATVRYFDMAQLPEARAWLNE
ncbi:UspA domain protein [Chthoniobacter flavus Ellin428]|uniref:UspA domain protein n=1 Tax=Chthoniobacter flavus Ellin428 TaxID=497964 RepID=B4CWX2_9BACT|nr:STAS/SEC14 domain-containing protein [Chthoniobacter flavus]EDY21292.1 UspA domain protein [Chthoniobacter flavus Ellin428]TCO84938.1 SpoIIAA-like protein [Chthoniobacter flavus]